jgi:hypothetical protein
VQAGLSTSDIVSLAAVDALHAVAMVRTERGFLPGEFETTADGGITWHAAPG